MDNIKEQLERLNIQVTALQKDFYSKSILPSFERTLNKIFDDDFKKLFDRIRRIELNIIDLSNLQNENMLRIDKIENAQKSTTKPKASGHNTRLKKERVLHKK